MESKPNLGLMMTSKVYMGSLMKSKTHSAAKLQLAYLALITVSKVQMESLMEFMPQLTASEVHMVSFSDKCIFHS